MQNEPMQNGEQPAETVNDPMNDLRKNFRRLAERLTSDVEPATIYCIHPVDSDAE